MTEHHIQQKTINRLQRMKTQSIQDIAQNFGFDTNVPLEEVGIVIGSRETEPGTLWILEYQDCSDDRFVLTRQKTGEFGTDSSLKYFSIPTATLEEFLSYYGFDEIVEEPLGPKEWYMDQYDNEPTRWDLDDIQDYANYVYQFKTKNK